MNNQLTIAPSPETILKGKRIRLEPLALHHVNGLIQWALEPDLWSKTQKHIHSVVEFEEWIGNALAARERTTEVPFAVIESQSGRPIGSTRYQNIDLTNRRLEIGWSWIALPWHGTGVNTEMKYLMLCHAFDELGFIRVEFKTNGQNTRSRAALRKLGAREEGVFRKWRVGPDGKVNDTAWYSIIDDEWPDVKKPLEARLADFN